MGRLQGVRRSQWLLHWQEAQRGSRPGATEKIANTPEINAPVSAISPQHSMQIRHTASESITGQTEATGIIVMGPFRSGTSLTCRILSALGVDFGPTNGMLKPDIFNPAGYVQRADVKLANSRLIRSAGSSVAWPAHPEILARSGDSRLLASPDLKWRATAPVWGMKDPRFCATLMAWLHSGVLQQDLIRLVVVSRSRDDCAKSMFAMPELARQLRSGTLASAKETIDRYAEFASWHAEHLDRPVFRINFEDLLASPVGRITDLARFIGGGNDARIEAAIRLV